MNVNFDNFEEMICYCWGDIYKIIKFKRFFWEIEKKIDVFERVVLLIKFLNIKDINFFENFLEEYNLMFSKIYFYLYKNIFKDDIEFLFFNIKISMILKDCLMLIVFVIGVVVFIVLKILF